MREITLFTNIGFCALQNVDLRLEAHALLLCPADDEKGAPGKKYHELRGLSMDGTSPIFSLTVETTEWTISAADDPYRIVLSSDGSTYPLFSGGLLTIGEHEIFVQAEDRKKTIQVDKFTPPSREGKTEEEFSNLYTVFWNKLWNTVQSRIAEFWHAPYIGITRQYLPIEYVRLCSAKQEAVSNLSKTDLTRITLIIRVLRKKGEATLAEIDDALDHFGDLVDGSVRSSTQHLMGLHEELSDLRRSVLKKTKKEVR